MLTEWKVRKAAYAAFASTSSEKAVPLALLAATPIRTAVPLVFGSSVPRHFRPGRRLTKMQPCGQTGGQHGLFFYSASYTKIKRFARFRLC